MDEHGRVRVQISMAPEFVAELRFRAVALEFNGLSDLVRRLCWQWLIHTEQTPELKAKCSERAWKSYQREYEPHGYLERRALKIPLVISPTDFIEVVPGIPEVPGGDDDEYPPDYEPDRS